MAATHARLSLVRFTYTRAHERVLQDLSRTDSAVLIFRPGPAGSINGDEGVLVVRGESIKGRPVADVNVDRCMQTGNRFGEPIVDTNTVIFVYCVALLSL